MSAALSINQANETKWTIVSGPMKGSVRLMSTSAFTIGRSTECEFVVVSDPKCSRKHAQVRLTPQGYEITGLSESNPVLINGNPVTTATLNDNDVVTLGDTEVKFNLTSTQSISHAQPEMTRSSSKARSQTQISVVPRGAPVPHQAPQAPAYYNPYPQQPPQYAQRQAPPRSPAQKKNPIKMILYGVIGLMIFMLATYKKEEKSAASKLRTEQQIQADIDAANKLNEVAQKTPNKRLDDSLTSRQAQENFVRGFRDYRKGQFERSLDSFQACLALDPAHALCNRYMRLGQRRFNEIVQQNIVLGRKYRNENQYQACRSAFRNVMVMVKDANSLAYKEAKANYDACNNFVEGRY